jgi:small subunit ribosomal protein S4
MVAGHVNRGEYKFMKDPACKKCRRAGQKLFLKGGRCFTPKCAMVKKAYAPGAHGKKRRRAMTEYGSQLAEKQKLKRIYGTDEKQLKKYFKEAAKSKGASTEILLSKLETRIDNVIFRLGWAESRAKARQVVGHGHILLNNRKVNIPSIHVRKGDAITIKKSSLNKSLFKDLKTRLKKYNPPNWLLLDKKELKGAVASLPTRDDVDTGIDLQMIVEYYSR